MNCAQVRSVGTVVGGLSAEQLRSIPPKAMRGLTVSAVASVTTNNFKALTTHQIQRSWQTFIGIY